MFVIRFIYPATCGPKGHGSSSATSKEAPVLYLQTERWCVCHIPMRLGHGSAGFPRVYEHDLILSPSSDRPQSHACLAVKVGLPYLLLPTLAENEEEEGRKRTKEKTKKATHSHGGAALLVLMSPIDH